MILFTGALGLLAIVLGVYVFAFVVAAIHYLITGKPL